MNVLDPKDPEEEIYYGFDFAKLLDAIGGESLSTAVASIRVTVGTDPTPSAMLSGQAVIDGTKAKQLLTGGVAGNTYLFAIAVETSAGQTFVESGPIRVLEKN